MYPTGGCQGSGTATGSTCYQLNMFQLDSLECIMAYGCNLNAVEVNKLDKLYLYGFKGLPCQSLAILSSCSSCDNKLGLCIDFLKFRSSKAEA